MFFGSCLARQLDSQELANPSSQTSKNALWPNTKTSSQSVSCEELPAGNGSGMATTKKSVKSTINFEINYHS